MHAPRILRFATKTMWHRKSRRAPASDVVLPTHTRPWMRMHVEGAVVSRRKSFARITHPSIHPLIAYAVWVRVFPIYLMWAEMCCLHTCLTLIDECDGGFFLLLLATISQWQTG